MAQKTILHQWFDEIWNKNNPDAVDQFLAPKAILHRLDEEGKDAPGSADFKAFFRRFRGAFPDLHVEVVDVVVSGNRVAGRWIATGTHTGDTLGIPATGRAIRLDGMSMARLKNGKVAEGWNIYDTYKMLQQLGLVQAGTMGAGA